MNSPDLKSTTICRCDPAAEKFVLALAAQAWPEAERAAYWRSIGNLIAEQRANQVVLVAAHENDTLVAAQVAQVLPGRAAAIWAPQFNDGDSGQRRGLVAAMFEQATLGMTAEGAQLAQALLPCDHPEADLPFALGGFSHAANLFYLTAELTADVPLPALPFDIEPFTPEAMPRLIKVLERTYRGSLDCPRIDGLRQTADVVAGYQAVGEHRPELWCIVRHAGADIGCLLLNLHPDVRHAEIVYVALVPEMRGRGWGQLLTQQALWLARRTQSQRVVLAVDANNQPAIDMYAKNGFSIFDRRAVWIKPLV